MTKKNSSPESISRIHGHLWQIRTEDAFFEHCDFAQTAIDFASQFNTNEVRWFFDSCTANWVESVFSVVFKSYNLPAYKDHRLSITVNGGKAAGYRFEKGVQIPPNVV